MKTYNHISSEERDKISVLRAQGVKVSEIAKILGRNKGTVSRELKRNKSSTYNVYLSHRAHERSMIRKSTACKRPRLKNSAITNYTIEKLKLGWSPEQIAGRISNDLPGCTISHEAIYQFIYDKQTLKSMDLRPLLTRRHRKRLIRGYSRKHKKTHIPLRTSIKERPDYINQRLETGHWEIDTVISRQSSYSLAVALERLTRHINITRLPHKKAKELRTALTIRLSRYPGYMRRSLTYDNGSENTEHILLNKSLGTQSYFCEPYHSWEKGSVENSISLIRRFLPKKTDFGMVTKEQIMHIETLLNNRPRKCLDYKTPNEVFYQSVALAG